LTRLYGYTSNANPTPGCYKADYRRLLDNDKYKRDCPLSTLVKHYPNVVNNLTTKGDLSYEDLKERLTSYLPMDSLTATTVATTLLVPMAMGILAPPWLLQAMATIKLEEKEGNKSNKGNKGNKPNLPELRYAHTANAMVAAPKATTGKIAEPLNEIKTKRGRTLMPK